MSTGLIGSGKDTFADYIEENHGFAKVVFSEVLNKMLRKEGIEVNRENQQKYREEHGSDFLAKATVEEIQTLKSESNDKFVISGPRKLSDYFIPKKKLDDDVWLVLIEADEEKRWKRLKSRGGPKDENLTKKKFDAQEKKEFELYDFDKLFKLADFKISNNKTKKDFFRKIDKIMEEIK